MSKEAAKRLIIDRLNNAHTVCVDQDTYKKGILVGMVCAFKLDNTLSEEDGNEILADIFMNYF